MILLELQALISRTDISQWTGRFFMINPLNTVKFITRLAPETRESSNVGLKLMLVALKEVLFNYGTFLQSLQKSLK